MGDPISITTWPKHQNLFYLVTSSGISFDVKSHGNAAVGLAKKPGKKVDYWVGIGDNGHCWIKKDDDQTKSVHLLNILSPEYYSRFWLQWNAGAIRLGRHGEQKPIVTYASKVPALKYITFSVLNQHPVHWKFDLPPLRPNCNVFKPISGGKLTWVQAENQLPDESLIGGFEKEVLYIIRSSHRGSVTPGKFKPSDGVGYISWGGAAHSKTELEGLEVLCGFNCTWVPTCEDRIPVGAFVGGYSEDRQERLYVGRAEHNGHIIPGKVQPSHKACYIPFDDREIAKSKYEILVEPSLVRSFNATYLSNINVDSTSDSEPEVDYTWADDDDDEENEDDDDDYGFNEAMEEVMAL